MTRNLMKTTAPALNVVDGTPTVSSLDVARHFGKRHDNVLRDIEALKGACDEEFRRLNFEETINRVKGPKGATRTEPAYNLTRDGFALLAMGFTGEKAIAFKVAYIKAFNQMEAELSGRYVAPLSNEKEFRDSLKLGERLKLQQVGQKIAKKLDGAPGPKETMVLYWHLRQVNNTLGIPTPSMEAMGIAAPALKGGAA